MELTAAIERLRHRPIAATEKGFGAITADTADAADAAGTCAALAASRPHALDGHFTLPILLLRDSALGHNAAAMADWCAAAGVRLAPHGKTTMAPQIFARQLQAGAWAITAATIAQARVYREFGVDRILIANELADPAGIRWLARELASAPAFDCYAYADSVAGVRLLDAELAAGGAGGAIRPVKVLVELGFPGGRTGCRDHPTALEVAAAVRPARRLRLTRAAGNEGGRGPGSAPATLDSVAAYCRELRDLAVTLRSAPGPAPWPDGAPGTPDTPGALGPPGTPGTPGTPRDTGDQGEWIVSAGGSMYFDVVARELTARSAAGTPGLTVVLRSGCYITHDHGNYADDGPRGDRGGPDLTAALELWTSVLSCPEPGLALALAGRRDVGSDQGLPVPLRIRDASGDPDTERPATGMKVTRLDDQHAYLDVPPGVTLTPGDLICLGVSHPCTTFDKWRVIPVIDDDYRVIDAVHTFF